MVERSRMAVEKISAEVVNAQDGSLDSLQDDEQQQAADDILTRLRTTANQIMAGKLTFAMNFFTVVEKNLT